MYVISLLLSKVSLGSWCRSVYEDMVSEDSFCVERRPCLTTLEHSVQPSGEHHSSPLHSLLLC